MKNNCCDNKYPYFDYRTLMDPRRAKQIQPVEGVVFNAVVIPASLGSSEEGQPYAPKNGLFKNAVVQYEADGATFIYTSDGVPVPIVNVVLSVNGHTGTVVLKTSDLENDADFQSGVQVAATVNTAVAEEAALRAAADGNLQTAITNEAGARASADTTLQANIDAEALARGNADATLQGNIDAEVTARQGADVSLQGQIDAITASSDVKDIVGTYAELQAYDTSTLGDKDIIKVLQDENQNNETTYYRWSTASETFTLIGEEGPYYTKAAADAKFQDKLTAGDNISIDANDVISATDTTYTDFVGTDGTTTGTSGLVPAPATTDAGKFLRADGTWDSAGGGIDPSTTFWGQTVNNGVVNGNIIFDDSVNLGVITTQNNRSSIYLQKINPAVLLNAGILSFQVGMDDRADPTSVGIGNYVGVYAQGTGPRGINMKTLGKIINLADPTDAQDATTKNYTDNIVVSYAALNGSTTPTTATEAKYIGQLYYDTTNEDLYYCSAITAQGTDPETYEYTWTAMGGGQSVTLYNTYGQNTDGAMTQKATTDLVYTGGDPTKINIGDNGVTGGTNSIIIGSEDSGTITAASDQIIIGHNITDASRDTIAIGHGASVNGADSIAIGRDVIAPSSDSVIIGVEAKASAGGNTNVCIGRRAGYRGTSNGNAVCVGYNTMSSYQGIAIGNGAGSLNYNGSISIGVAAKAQGAGSVALGAYSSTPIGVQGVVGIGADQTLYGYQSSNYRLLKGLYDAQEDHDAVNLQQLNSRIIAGGTAAPTTSTVGVVGTLYSYVDTTGTTPTPVLSVCTAVDTTDPSNPTYTWQQLI